MEVCGKVFISWVSLFYSSLQASVQHTSHHLSLPLLFALVIEPLVIMLKTSTYLRGVCQGNMLYWVSLYADDLLLCITDPVSCTIKITQNLQNHCLQNSVSPINSSTKNQPTKLIQGQIPFHFSPESFSYMGISITHIF